MLQVLTSVMGEGRVRSLELLHQTKHRNFHSQFAILVGETFFDFEMDNFARAIKNARGAVASYAFPITKARTKTWHAFAARIWTKPRSHLGLA